MNNKTPIYIYYILYHGRIDNFAKMLKLYLKKPKNCKPKYNNLQGKPS